MKKRGFTLVELLAVLVLIAAISLVVFPSIINYINNSKGDINEVTKQMIITSANQYMSDKYQQELNASVCFDLQTLIDNEYLEKSTLTNQASKIDPNTTYIQADYAIDPDLKTEKYIIKIVTKCVTYGDVNLDGNVNSTDFDALKTYIKGGSSLSEEAFANADVTLDGKVDIIDLAVLRARLSNTLTDLPFSIDSDKFKFGDLDLDGEVTEKDSVMLDRYIAEWFDFTSLQKIAADLNLDGTIDSQDSLIMSKYLANWADYKTLPKID